MAKNAAAFLILLIATATLQAEPRGIFDYEAQRDAADDKVKIVFIGDAGTHGPPGNHEFVAGSILRVAQGGPEPSRPWKLSYTTFWKTAVCAAVFAPTAV